MPTDDHETLHGLLIGRMDELRIEVREVSDGFNVLFETVKAESQLSLVHRSAMSEEIAELKGEVAGNSKITADYVEGVRFRARVMRLLAGLAVAFGLVVGLWENIRKVLAAWVGMS